MYTRPPERNICIRCPHIPCGKCIWDDEKANGRGISDQEKHRRKRSPGKDAIATKLYPRFIYWPAEYFFLFLFYNNFVIGWVRNASLEKFFIRDSAGRFGSGKSLVLVCPVFFVLTFLNAPIRSGCRLAFSCPTSQPITHYIMYLEQT